MIPVSARCCIAGGGPAGMMLGLLLARAGVDVLVLEKHADFLRDFRGDTIHPSTLEVMHELGLLDELLTRRHTKLRSAGAQIGAEFLEMADFTHLPTRCGFIALMPQWDFLDFLAGHAKRYANFRLMMRTEATGLIEDAGVGDGAARARAGWRDGDPRRFGCCRGRAAFGAAGCKRFQAARSWRADRRAVDAAVAARR